MSLAEKASRNALRRAKAADLTPEQKAEANAKRRAAYAAKKAAAQGGDATATSTEQPSTGDQIEALYERDDRLRDEINAESLRAHDADPNTFIEPSPEKKAEAAAAHARIQELSAERKQVRAQIDRLRKAGA